MYIILLLVETQLICLTLMDYQEEKQKLVYISESETAITCVIELLMLTFCVVKERLVGISNRK